MRRMYIKEYLYIGKVLLLFETYIFYTYTYWKKCPHFGYVVAAEKENEKGRVPRPRRLPRPLPYRSGRSNLSLCLLKTAKIQHISGFRYVQYKKILSFFFKIKILCAHYFKTTYFVLFIWCILMKTDLFIMMISWIPNLEFRFFFQLFNQSCLSIIGLFG